METLAKLKKKHKKEIEQLKKNEKYCKNFEKLLKKEKISCDIDMFYNAEGIFNSQSISINVDNFKEGLRLYKQFYRYTQKLYKLKNYGSVYAESDIKDKEKEVDFKLKNKCFYSVKKFSLNYSHSEHLVFQITFNNLHYDITINIKQLNCSYDFDYYRYGKRGLILKDDNVSNSILINNRLPFYNKLKIGSHNNINNFILYNINQ